MKFKENIKKEKLGNDLTQGKILNTLLMFAVPMVLTNTIQKFYSLVDLMFIGKFIGSEGTAGVSIGSNLTDLAMVISATFASAGQIYIAQLSGAKDHIRIKETIGTLFYILFIGSIISVLILIGFHNPFLKLLNCPREAIINAVIYIKILAVGVPFVFGFNCICGILRGLGESVKPLFFIIFAAINNIFFDFLLMAVFKLQVVGAAWATVLSQIGAFLAALLFIFRNQHRFDFELKLDDFKIRKQPLKIILMIGIPKLIQVIFIISSQLWCNARINTYGLTASVANGIGSKIQSVSNVFMQGVDMAAAAMIGQNLGAKKYDRIKRIVLVTLACCLVIAVVASSLTVLIPRTIFSIFSSDPAVLEMGVVYMRILVITFFLASLLSTFQSVVTGSGFASMSFAIGILDGVVCRIGFSLLFLYVYHYEVISYFLGTALARLLPAIICMIYFFSGKWRYRKLLVEYVKK